MTSVEVIDNNFATTLTSNVLIADTTIQVASNATATLQTGNFRVLIDQEIMLVTAGQSGTTWTVSRGQENTAAAAHTSPAAVVHVLTAGALLNGAAWQASSNVVGVTQLTDAATVTVSLNNNGGFLATLSQSTTFAAWTGSPTNLRAYVLAITSSSAQTLTFTSGSGGFSAGTFIPLPTQTSGGGLTDWLIFRYNPGSNKMNLTGVALGCP